MELERSDRIGHSGMVIGYMDYGLKRWIVERQIVRERSFCV